MSVQGLLGEIFYNNKKYKEAECELRGCWEKRKEVLGEEDKNTLNTQLWLGSTLYQEKKYEEAREILKDCYQKRKEGFGEDDDNTLTVQKWLGSTLYEEKKYEEAERTVLRLQRLPVKKKTVSASLQISGSALKIYANWTI